MLGVEKVGQSVWKVIKISHSLRGLAICTKDFSQSQRRNILKKLVIYWEAKQFTQNTLVNPKQKKKYLIENYTKDFRPPIDKRLRSLLEKKCF